jgi:hypothetical protein
MERLCYIPSLVALDLARTWLDVCRVCRWCFLDPLRPCCGGDWMILFVSGSTNTVRRVAPLCVGNLGLLLTPKNRNSVASIIETGLPWIADNGAFSGFDPAGFQSFLRKITDKPRCQFVVCPDVVADAKATLAMFDEWCWPCRRTNQPVAFVGQDGLENLTVPWYAFDAFFIGGSTEWKLSNAAMELAKTAKREGKWVHMGRVNSLKRMVYANLIGCNSVDGSSASMFGDKYIHKYCRWLKNLSAQQQLFS